MAYFRLQISEVFFFSLKLFCPVKHHHIIGMEGVLVCTSIHTLLNIGLTPEMRKQSICIPVKYLSLFSVGQHLLYKQANEVELDLRSIFLIWCQS